ATTMTIAITSQRRCLWLLSNGSISLDNAPLRQRFRPGVDPSSVDRRHRSTGPPGEESIAHRPCSTRVELLFGCKDSVKGRKEKGVAGGRQRTSSLPAGSGSGGATLQFLLLLVGGRPVHPFVCKANHFSVHAPHLAQSLQHRRRIPFQIKLRMEFFDRHVL